MSEAADINNRVSDRLAALLTELYSDNPNVFHPQSPQVKAEELLAAKFQNRSTLQVLQHTHNMRIVPLSLLVRTQRVPAIRTIL